MIQEAEKKPSEKNHIQIEGWEITWSLRFERHLNMKETQITKRLFTLFYKGIKWKKWLEIEVK